MRRHTSESRVNPSRLLAALVAVLLALPLLGVSPVAAQESETSEAAPSPLAIEAVTVEPANPGPDTLCRLSVKLRNDGESTASQLGFTVKVNGQELAPYRNQLYMFPLAAGASDQLQLYNFWSTESSRPAPSNGKLELEVTLEEARWMTIGMEDDVEVWTPGDDVPGLPLTRSLTVEMAAGD